MKGRFLLGLVLLIASCRPAGPEGAARSKAVTLQSTASATMNLMAPVVAYRDGAVVKGKVIFEGTAPKDKKVSMDADPYCSKAHTEPVKTEIYVIGKGGEMANVFVWVKKGLEGRKYDAPKEAAVLDQVGCRYSPHVMGLMVGQTIKIRNSDDTMHNVHGMSTANPEFNFGQSKKGAEAEKVFASPEFFKVKCDVHGWMSAWVCVVPNPFYAVTGADGTFELKDLPAGEYEIEAWHEKLGTQSATVKVGDKESKDVNFAFKAAK